VLQPVHVNAGFALSRDRRSIISGSDVFDKQLLVKYNQGTYYSGSFATIVVTLTHVVPHTALLTDAVAWAYARLLLRLADDCQKGLLPLKPDHYYQLWPKKKDIVSGGGQYPRGWNQPYLLTLTSGGGDIARCRRLPVVARCGAGTEASARQESLRLCLFADNAGTRTS
jgi:hypothetical protein